MHRPPSDNGVRSSQTEGFLSEEAAEVALEARRRFAAEFQILIDACQAAHRLLGELQVAPDNIRELLAATTFERLLSTVEGAILLLQRGMIPQVHILARSAIETWFILAAVAKDPSFAELFVLSEEHARKNGLTRLIRGAKRRGRSDADLATELQLLAQLEASLEEKRPRDFNTFEVAKIGGRLDYYDSAYVHLSLAVHTSLRSLDQAITKVDAQGLVAELERGPSFEGFEMAADLLAEPLIVGMGDLLAVFPGLTDPGWAALHQRLRELRLL